ncbi:beta-glucanase [Niveomyces insectorum RCEF 264]|uniref:endo-1,3(4)-beta-glucanase n=1 Tax=Niveomyces insectorum RCEF 264 TaxID=1081102 RepID=A0A162MTK0_9HYPO|nr:beta-glucanase [Niveomyces insectorum RCEF 264]
MKSQSTAFIASLLAATARATPYTLIDNFNASNFFSGFSFFDAPDPTHGFVNYASAQVASQQGLAGYVNNMVYLGVDHITADPATGRASTRVTSNTAYQRGLFVADIAHMPVGCGVWPAFWTLGPNWPAGGEIDIVEGVNSQTTDTITLHTAPGCVMSNTGSTAGTVYTAGTASFDCGAGNGNTGCSLATADAQGYGDAFNANGGGVYAMELASSAISVWFFPRGSAMAAQLSAGGGAPPDTATFGTPTARFSGCDVDAYFAAQQIVLDTTLCGDWAGNVWSQDATCAARGSSCAAYVAQNPDAFVDAYWLINSIQVYQAAASAGPIRGNGSSSRKRRTAPPSRGVVPTPFLA